MERQRQPEWAESVAVGNEAFILQMRQRMGMDLPGRKIGQVEDAYILREPENTYGDHFDDEKMSLSIENAVCFDESE